MRSVLVLALVGLGACDADPPAQDAGARDGGSSDGGASDGGASDGGASDGGAGDGGSSDAGADAGVEELCPPGSGALTLELSGVTLERVPGLPLDDGFVSGFAIVEGPVWARGALYFSHFGGGPTPASRILRLDPSGVVSVAAGDAGVNGLALGPDGRLYGGRHMDGSVSVFDWDDLAAAPSPVVARYEGARFNSPNDLVLHSNGTLYFSDPGWQAPSPAPQAAERAYRVPPGGAPEPIAGTPSRPNGIALSLDERALFVTGTNGMRRYVLDASGAIVEGPLDVAAVSGGLDGLGRDCAGNLYVTGGERVRVLGPDLTLLGELAAPGATNVAFGGDDRRTLYVTALGAGAGLLRARLNVPGLPD
ncbi:MAG: SMP-30/gluconolactonase/LRE family protein [Sandaracinaceae bacterium]|nr:SMP-30/gluconolactonase/LRE family protein [Sandaracinaceae bacterium]